MEYIVFDLEWNQCPGGKEDEIQELPFEILEIGAVKLDSNRNIVDSFHSLIKPQVYKELHYITQDILNTDIHELEKGETFEVVVDKFLNWCGTDNRKYMFCSWGTMDLTELQRNMRFYNIEWNFPRPFIYYDIQKLFSYCYEDHKIRRTLEYAVGYLDIEADSPFHSAYSDAVYTAKVFSQIDFDSYRQYTSIDTYYIPRNRKEEIKIDYGTYTKYVSSGFADKESLLKDPNVISTECALCNRKVKKKIRWFSASSKMEYCIAYCEKHGYIKGKLKIKKDNFDNYYAVKILKYTDDAGVKSIKERQTDTRKKRKERRKREKEKMRQS